MVKTFHEAPKSIFNRVQSITSGDYALVHLFEEDKEYFNLFKQAVEQDREVILDNSIFELGKAFNSKKYLHWINKLKPTWYIIPDVLEDADATIEKAKEWQEKYSEQAHGKTIGVVQGKTYQDIVRCYKYFDEVADVDMIAISFDYSFYEKLIPNKNKLVSWMLGRVALIEQLQKDGILNLNKKHHLLGVALYWEGEFYKEDSFIYSIDTSNPVVFGIKGRYYQGLTWDKPSEKLFTMINLPVEDIDVKKVSSNILTFLRAWNKTINLQ